MSLQEPQHMSSPIIIIDDDDEEQVRASLATHFQASHQEALGPRS